MKVGSIVLLCTLATICCGTVCRAEEYIELAPMVRGKHIFPAFGKRITLIKEQIDLAVSKSWISSDQASTLRGEATRLEGLDSRLTQTSPASETDEIDRGITKLNADLQDAMKSGSPPSAAASELEAAPVAQSAAAIGAKSIKPAAGGKSAKAATPASQSASGSSAASASSLMKSLKPLKVKQ